MKSSVIHKIILITTLWLRLNGLMAQMELKMQNGKFYVCNGYILDSDAGKNKDYYDHNENFILTLAMPNTKKITLDFLSFCTEPDNDVLSIFDGKDTNSNLLGRYSGTKSIGKISSSDSFITLHFITDKSVSCTGWKAKVINDFNQPQAIKLSLIQSVKCNDSIIEISLDKNIECDSINTNNTFIKNLNINYIKPINCTNSLASKFRLSIDGSFTQNGNFELVHQHGYRNFCDSVYFSKSNLKFNLLDCPLSVDLKSRTDTICLGECVQLNVATSGGDSSKYNYTWNIPGLFGKANSVCPKVNTLYKVEVRDGNAVPGIDSMNIVVLAPPTAQNDTQVCYYSDTFQLKAEPSGGKWYGPGIINRNTGFFNPKIGVGNFKVWYQIGNCTDTVLISVNVPWNLENLYCPNTKPSPVYWFGPSGGSWTGPKITADGIFNPDSIGMYTVQYEWKGCKSNKIIRVENINVPQSDTTCESAQRDTLNFSPKGLIVNNFKGLLNAYWGWFDPSSMGGPGNYPIFFQGNTGCRDTQFLTVLPCYAGNDDTICPNSNQFYLTGFRKGNEAYWKGKGIVDSISGLYSPSWTNGKNAIDTVWLISTRCIDFKLIYLINTALQKDTIALCPEIQKYPLNLVQTTVSNGIWNGLNVSNDTFFLNTLLPGFYNISYSKNQCTADLKILILEPTLVPADTVLCNNVQKVKFNSIEPGKFIGNEIDSIGNLILSNTKSDSLRIWFINKFGCIGDFNVKIQRPTAIILPNIQPQWCFRDSNISLPINPPNGYFKVEDKYVLDSINTKTLGTGNHRIKYVYDDGVCVSVDSFDFFVLDSLNTVLSKSKDTICPGELLILEAIGKGGLGNYTYHWANGFSSSKILLNPQKTFSLQLKVADGCSDIQSVEIPIFVHPDLWFTLNKGDTVCYGNDALVFFKLRNGDPSEIVWNYPIKQSSDTFILPGGNSYKVFVTDKTSGCFKDTVFDLPGFDKIFAEMSLSRPLNGNCYTFIDSFIDLNARISGQQIGKIWLNNQFLGEYPNIQRIPLFDTLFTINNRLKFTVTNERGCSNTSLIEWCFKDTILAYIPNAFTPNDDGINDVWKWNISGAEEVELFIYNRWGEIIYKSNRLDASWDGEYLNKPCEEGLYVAYITYKNSRNFRKSISTNIMLLRGK